VNQRHVTSRAPEVIVAGLGAMGSAALFHLASRGVPALGIDRFSPPHTMGSTHGQSRIIREAYYEHPQYVPLVRRAYELWSELEERSGSAIYRRTGGLMLGPPDGPVVSGSRASAIAHGLDHEMHTASEVRSRFPGFTPPDEFVGLWEDRAGLLFPEAAVSAHLSLARQLGAEVRTDTRILSWAAGPTGARVETTQGTFEAARLVLSLGSWLPSLLGPLGQSFQVERQFFHWFKPLSDASRWPVALWEYRPGGLVYTLPDRSDRVKAGIHHEGTLVDPETVNREPSPEDETRIRSLLAPYQPAANGPLLDAVVCLYTNTPDHHFVIDWHPTHASVLLVSPCSGHGFKFSSAIGEVVADLVATGRSRFDLSPFSVGRVRRA
jgi:sarcosine oxidase